VQLRVAIEEDREKLNKKEALFKIISQNLRKKTKLIYCNQTFLLYILRC